MLPRYSLTLLVGLLLAGGPAALAQQSVGIGTTTPHSSAALDVSSSGKGLLPPRMPQVQRDLIGSPAAGLTIYNTTTNKLNTWNGTVWTEALTTTEQPQPPALTSQTFGYTGGPQTYTVPAGVNTITVDAAGAQGGSNGGGNGGGPGARAQVTLAVTPGETLTLYVGGAGSPATGGPGGAGYNGGGNGGNSSGNRGGGGGGASDVRRSATAPSTALAERLLVAAGGGGGGNSGSGGVGGAPDGTAGAGGTPGTGATQSAGGNLGGALGQGGSAPGSNPSGGGGGGYYGGGGGTSFGGGGGGSSWSTPTGSSGLVLTGGFRAGSGLIVIAPGPQYASPALDGANFVNVPGDHLGNHTATRALNLGTNQLVGNGGTSGLAISSAGTVGIGGAVGIGTTTPATSAQLEVASTTKGFLPPRLTQNQRDLIGSPAAGLTIYNTTSNMLNVWNGTAWTESLSAAAPGVAYPVATFAYTGGTQTYTVPVGVVTIQVDAVGGQGGGRSGSSPSSPSGRGGRVQATLSVTPGEVLTIAVGGQGGSTPTSAGSSPGGYNGGGLGWNASGGGGGATDIRRGGTTLTHRVLVAGGGGGQCENDPYGGPYGGNGGGLTGATGGGAFTFGRGGTGGSQTSGGFINGALGLGGDGNNPGGGTYGGAGGGGGYYGGGGGYYGSSGNGSGTYSAGGGGGGGSSWTTPAGSNNVVHTQGHSTGHGSVTITPGGPYAAPTLNGSNIVGLTVASIGFAPQAGGVVYSDGSALRQNPGQLFWDDATNRLGVGTGSPVASAILEVASTTGGFLPPRMTETQRDAIAAPATGLVIYNTFRQKPNTWNGTAWTEPISTAEVPFQHPITAFYLTHGVQTYTVPPNVYSLRIEANGGRGGTQGNVVGGYGAQVFTTLTVVPGQVLQVLVGGAGTTASPRLGGYNGGGDGGSNSASGGGPSDVRLVGGTLADRLVVAGGGGGGSTGGSFRVGGAGGAPNGGNGSNAYSGGPVATGGTQTAGGTSPGGSPATGSTGASGVGGAGGGGYFGGGAGESGASGAGGSSWVTTTGTSGTTMFAGTNAGDGRVVITPMALYATPALSGTNFTNLPAASLTGSVPAASLTNVPAASLTGSVPVASLTSVPAASLTGSVPAASLTSVPAASLTGVVAVANLPTLTSSTSGTNRTLTLGTGNSTSFSVGDDLGTHNATTRLNLGANALVGNGGTTGLTITSGGNVGIGATATEALDVNGGILARSNSAISFQGAHLQWNRTGGEGETWLLNQKGGGSNAGIRFGSATTANAVTEWARFNDSGDLGLGTTSPDAKLDIASSAQQQLIITSTAADPTGVITLTIPATNSACNTCSEFMLFYKAGGSSIGSIGSNLSGNSVTYNTSSDKRLKENIGRTRFGLQDLLKIQVKDYNFIGTSAASRVTGFLAQDLFRIYPDAVKEGDYGTTVTNAWAVDYGRLTPLLVQAIQDQQAQIEVLRAQNASQQTLHQQETGQLRTQLNQQQASLQTLQEQMARLLGEVPPATQAHK